MGEAWTVAGARIASRVELFLPLLFSLWMAGMDLAYRRIPNYLTLGAAVAGLGFQMGWHGWPGLINGFGGGVLGLCLLLWPYLKGGRGAGDVKGLAALGTWLGMEGICYLFLYMGLSGGLISLVVLIWQGRLGALLKRSSIQLASWGLGQVGPEIPARGEPGRLDIPYGAALALGMAIFCWRWQNWVPK